MGFFEIRSNVKSLNPRDPRRAACVRSEPECVVLPVEDGALASAKPPVRVFLGTEPGQHRAERIFVWSIEQNRDPSRVYEIYLMKDLAGFDRRGWTTGFTNYRFAVPHLAGGRGRAIFNDVDEAYVGDPADLFDADMGDHGYLATSDTETSVMLIDCERMARVWPLEASQRELKKRLLARSLAEHPGIRGDLPAEWTARDEDFQPGFSKLQHWTTLHTQPWRPVPGRFVYEPNPTGHLWFDLERAADDAGYQVFSSARPSSLYTDLIARLRGASLSLNGKKAPVSGLGQRLREVVDRVGARTVLDYGLARSSQDSSASWLDLPGAVQVSRFDLAAPDEDIPTSDGVLCEGVLELLPDEDAPWVIGDLFARASGFVYAVIRNDAANVPVSGGPDVECHRRDLSWWLAHFETASRHRPELHWTLVFADRDSRGRECVRVRDNGRPGAAPSVWVLTDDRSQSAREGLALAEALGWQFEHKDLCIRPLGRLPGARLAASVAGVDRSRSTALEAPWPDVVISAGRRCVPVARWIRDQDQGRTRLVHVGPEGGEVADLFDAVITPGWARLWPHPNRIETAASLVADRETRGTGVAPRSARPAQGLRRWVERRAHEHPLNLRGTARPQQGLEYLCARLIERGFVRPVPDRDELQPEPSRRAGRWGDALPFLRKVEDVAARVRDRLGFGEELRCQT